MAASARGRQPRPDPRPGRAGEQPQGRQRRAAEAPADGVHRGLRLGQELAGLRHHRRRVAADDQRDLQRVRPGLHADAGPARGRPPRGADDGDHRRPGADGRQPALDGRHRHRRQRDAADPVQPDRQAAHRPADGVLVQRPDPQGQRGDDDREGRRPRREERRPQAVYLGGMCPRCEGMGNVSDFDLTALYDETKSLGRGCAARSPATAWTAGTAGIFERRRARRWTSRSRRSPRSSSRSCSTASREDQGRGRQPHLRGRDPEDPEVDAVQGRRGDAAARPALRRAGGHLPTCPDCEGTRLDQGGLVLEDQRQEHRRGLRHADQRPRRVAARGRGARRGAAARRAAAPARLVRGDRARLPVARPARGHAVRGRGAADQDDPPPRVVAHRRHLRLRRADDRAAPARHRADEPAAAPAAGQGQHRAGRRAQARDDRDRRPRRRPRAGRRHRRRRGRLRGHLRRAAGERHRHRPAPRRPGVAQGRGARAVRRARGPQGLDAQPAGGRRRHPARACCASSPAWPARARAR